MLKEENEHVEVHEVRGFASDDLVGALNEAYAISRGTRCKQFLFSLSLNPPPSENVKTEAFESAVDRVEAKLGLSGQPRIILFHEKDGRRHCHAVWSRIRVDEMKAVQLSHSKRKLQDMARELHLEHGWQMPHGLMQSHERDPRNFTLAEWQQAKRAGKDPRAIKTVFQDCWAVSDTQAAFAQALKSRGFVLARRDRRGFVALDHQGEVYSVSKWVGIRAKDVRARLKDEAALPTTAQARAEIARDMAVRLRELQEEQRAVSNVRQALLERKSKTMAREHVAERKTLWEAHEARWRRETLERQNRFNKGLRGLVEAISGRRAKIRRENEREAYLAYLRDRAEKDALIFGQLEARRALQAQIEHERGLKRERLRALGQDISRYQGITRESLRARQQEILDRRRKSPAARSRDRGREDWGLER